MQLHHTRTHTAAKPHTAHTRVCTDCIINDSNMASIMQQQQQRRRSRLRQGGRANLFPSLPALFFSPQGLADFKRRKPIHSHTSHCCMGMSFMLHGLSFDQRLFVCLLARPTFLKTKSKSLSNTLAH